MLDQTCAFQFTGLLLLLVGLWAEFDLHKYMELSPELSGTAPHVLIGIACLIVLVSSIAFSCIIKGQPVLLYIVSGMYWTIDHAWSWSIFLMFVGHFGQTAKGTYNQTFSDRFDAVINLLIFQYGGFLACIFMMDAGVGAAAACYRDTFAKSLHDGLTQTITTNNPHKSNFDFAQKNVSVTYV